MIPERKRTDKRLRKKGVLVLKVPSRLATTKATSRSSRETPAVTPFGMTLTGNEQLRKTPEQTPGTLGFIDIPGLFKERIT